MMGGIAKAYLTSQLSGDLQVKLNDGRCSVNETEEFFFFHVPRKSSQCGSEKQVSGEHASAGGEWMVYGCLRLAGEQNAHHAAEHARHHSGEGADHQPAGPEGRLEVHLSETLRQQRPRGV